MSEGADKTAWEKSYSSSEPMHKSTAEDILREVKHIMDQQGVSYFLRQGTCLGAIRDRQLIPWDDDLDIGSVLGFHGVTETVVDQVVEAFKNCGFHVETDENDHYISVALMKSAIRTDWACYKVIGENVYHYPGVRIPARLFTMLKEIDFIGERFPVPNPPEEYLLFKYGPDWETPKKVGFDKDIIQMIPEVIIAGRLQRLKRVLARYVVRWRLGRIRVLDHEGSPVAGAEVIVAGQGRSRTSKGGYAKFYLPMADFYALVIRYGNQEEILYQEKLTPGKAYVYRADPAVSSGRMSILSPE